MIETLTDEERDSLENDTGAGCGRKALRIIDQLTRELDEALDAGTEANREKSAALGELNQALYACEHWSREAKHNADEVARLTRERDEAVSDHDAIHEQLRDAQSEVARLTKALAAANRGAAENGEAADTYRERAEAAEARVRELTERVSQALTGLRPGSPVREALEEALRAP